MRKNVLVVFGLVGSAVGVLSALNEASACPFFWAALAPLPVS